MPIAKFALAALDCPDPMELAKFYQQIVGGELVSETPASDWVRLETGTGCNIGFQRAPRYQAPEWPDGLPQQAHLDLDVDDLDTAEAQIIAIGARKTEIQPMPNEWRVYLDPAGHPFCLIQR
jgi:Glyoxalase-like domain